MRTATTLAAATALCLAAALPALACSGYKSAETAQTTMPAESQQTAQTPAPAGALTAPTETADAGKTEAQPVKAN